MEPVGGIMATYISVCLLAFTSLMYQVSTAATGLTVLETLLSVVNTGEDGATSVPPVRCLPGWRRHSRSCFRALPRTYAKYDEAREKCHQLDPSADLPIVRDVNDMAFIQGVVPGAGRPAPFFLGATDRELEGQFRWHDGSLVALGAWAWARREPSSTARQNCLLLIKQTSTRDGRALFSLGDTSCHSNSSVVVCQMPFPVLALPSSVRNAADDANLTKHPQTDGNGCDYPGAVRHAVSCYLYQDEYLTQQEAAQRCQDRGFQLAGVQSEQENDFIKYLILDVSWLGGRLSGSQWRWSDGQHLLFTRWAATGRYFHQQPNGDGHELCLNMLSSVRSGWVGEQQVAGDGYWADNDCSVRWPSVCETPAAVSGRIYPSVRHQLPSEAGDVRL